MKEGKRLFCFLPWTHQIVKVEFVLVRNFERAMMTIFGSGVLRFHVALQVRHELSARVTDAANGFHDGLGLFAWIVYSAVC